MISVLREFFYGNLNPCERPAKQDMEYDKALKAMVDAEAKLIASLNETEKVLYNEYAAAQRNFSLLEDVDQFVSGFRYGTLMAFDVMTGIDEII